MKTKDVRQWLIGIEGFAAISAIGGGIGLFFVILGCQRCAAFF